MRAEKPLTGKKQGVDRVAENGDNEHGHGDDQHLPHPGVAPDVPDELPEPAQRQLGPVQQACGGEDLPRDQGDPDDRRAPARAGEQAAHGAHGDDQDAQAEVRDPAHAPLPMTVFLAPAVAFLETLARPAPAEIPPMPPGVPSYAFDHSSDASLLRSLVITYAIDTIRLHRPRHTINLRTENRRRRPAG